MQTYPKSIYVKDAHARMLDIRQHLASHVLAIARYYHERQAWVAVVQRTNEILTDYPQEKVVLPALRLMKDAYVQLGLTDEAENTQRVINASTTPS